MNLSARNDGNMPFMMRFENVAWYENGKVRILDRRIYPIRIEYVIKMITKKSPKPSMIWLLKVKALIRRAAYGNG